MRAGVDDGRLEVIDLAIGTQGEVQRERCLRRASRRGGEHPAFLEALARVQRSLLSMATRLYARDLALLNRKLEDVATFMAWRDHPGAAPFLSVTISMCPLRDDW